MKKFAVLLLLLSVGMFSLVGCGSSDQGTTDGGTTDQATPTDDGGGTPPAEDGGGTPPAEDGATPPSDGNG